MCALIKYYDNWVSNFGDVSEYFNVKWFKCETIRRPLTAVFKDTPICRFACENGNKPSEQNPMMPLTQTGVYCRKIIPICTHLFAACRLQQLKVVSELTFA
jgi:hypothetical protein